MLTTTPNIVPEAHLNASTLSTRRFALQKLVGVLRQVEPWGQATFLLILRLIYGWFFIQTGWGKFMNFEQTSTFFTGLGLPAPLFMAALVATTELVGGVLLCLGLGTRLVSAVLVNVLVTALVTAHASDAFQGLSSFTEQAPYPFLVATLVLLVFGAGRLSLDGWRKATTAIH
jgi:putative oxidoreductase